MGVNLRAKYLITITLVAQGFLAAQPASSFLGAKDLVKMAPSPVPLPRNSGTASSVNAMSLDDGIKAGNDVRLLDVLLIHLGCPGRRQPGTTEVYQ
jgi:hypothetical protein